MPATLWIYICLLDNTYTYIISDLAASVFNTYVGYAGRREGRREEGRRKGGREGGRKGGREERREGGREGGREGRRKISW